MATSTGEAARDQESLLLMLTRGSAQATLRLFRDPGRAQRAFAHGGGYGIEHFDRVLDVRLHAALEALVSALRTSSAEEPIFGVRLMSALEQAARDRGASLRPRRLVRDGQQVPRWPAAMRTGPPPDDESLWPYDAELAALELGLRRLIRREWGAGEEEARARDARWLAAHGLCTAEHPRREGVVVLAAPSEAVLAEASEHERRVESTGEGWEASVRFMGDALGYPPCCVDVFTRAGRRTDGWLFAELLPDVRHAPLSPLSLWLDGALALVSHAPCTPTCEATRAIAAHVLVRLEATRPGFRSRWLDLAARLHVLTPAGRMLAVRGEGSLVDGTLLVSDAVELVSHGPRPDPRTLDGCAGMELRLDDLRLRCPGAPDLDATLFADHRKAFAATGARADDIFDTRGDASD